MLSGIRVRPARIPAVQLEDPSVLRHADSAQLQHQVLLSEERERHVCPKELRLQHFLLCLSVPGDYAEKQRPMHTDSSASYRTVDFWQFSQIVTYCSKECKLAKRTFDFLVRQGSFVVVTNTVFSAQLILFNFADHSVSLL